MCFEQVKITIFSSAKNLFKKIFSNEINLFKPPTNKAIQHLFLCTVDFQTKKGKKYKPKVKLD